MKAPRVALQSRHSTQFPLSALTRLNAEPQAYLPQRARMCELVHTASSKCGEALRQSRDSVRKIRGPQPLRFRLLMRQEITCCQAGATPYFGRWSVTACVVHLFDHLVGGRLQGQRHGQTERLCGLEVDHQLELARRLDRKIAGIFAPQHPIQIAGRSAK